MQNYQIIDFLKSEAVIIHPGIQRRDVCPFTMMAAKRFFDNFVRTSFRFDGVVRSIFIYDGKENLPRHSYAAGFLFAETPDQFETFEDLHGKLPDPIGTIHLEVGGNHPAPDLSVMRLSG